MCVGEREVPQREREREVHSMSAHMPHLARNTHLFLDVIDDARAGAAAEGRNGAATRKRPRVEVRTEKMTLSG